MRDYQTTFGIEVEAGGEPTPRAVALATAGLLGAVENATVYDAHVHDEAHADAGAVDPHEMLTLGVSLSFSSDDDPKAIFGLPEQVEACETAQELGTGPRPGPGEREDTVTLAEACNNCGWNDWHRYEPASGVDVWFECATPGCGKARLNPGGQMAEDTAAEPADLWVGAPGPEWEAATDESDQFVGGYEHPETGVEALVWEVQTDDDGAPEPIPITSEATPEADDRYVAERRDSEDVVEAESFVETEEAAYREAVRLANADRGGDEDGRPPEYETVDTEGSA
jgi:hypothetical protein